MNITALERAYLAELTRLSKINTSNVSFYWVKEDTKKFYADNKHLVLDREREINTYKQFLEDLKDAYAVVGSLQYEDVHLIYRLSIHNGFFR